MRRFIFGELDGIHIIDLLQTEALLENARRFAGELASGGGTVLFVGTKKQARDAVKEWADRCQMPYVNQRWLGGLLTNFNTMSARIARLHELNAWKEEGKLDLLPTKERMGMQAELAKLEFNLGGVRDMERLPDAVFVTDLKTEEIAVHEAARLRIPIIGLVDTNCDPNPIDYVIPGNDDAIRSCQLVIGTIGAAVETGASAWRDPGGKAHRRGDGAAPKEEEERRKREEEEKARLEAEEAGQSRCRGGGCRKQQARRPDWRRSRGSGSSGLPPAVAQGPPPPEAKAEAAAVEDARAIARFGSQSDPLQDRARTPPSRPKRARPHDAITAADVKALRDRTGAAMMDCKAALAEADGDAERAIELLRVKGQASAAKREGRGTEEGVVSAYIHANDRVGAMVEVQCETDFVARNEDFKAFAYEVALHVAASAPRYVSSDGDSRARSARPSGAYSRRRRARKASRTTWSRRSSRDSSPSGRARSRCLTSPTSTPISTTRKRSRSCARSLPPRPARTSGSPASPTSASARPEAGREVADRLFAAEQSRDLWIQAPSSAASCSSSPVRR